MKVDILSREYPPKVYGGAGVHAEELSKVLAERVDVTVRAFDGPRAENEIPEIPGDNPKGSLKVVGYDVPKELQEANGALKTFGVDLQIADDVDADIIHAHTWYACLAGYLAKMLHGTPLVITAHSLEPFRPWKREQLGGGYNLSSWAEKDAYEHADRVIAVSNLTRNIVINRYGVPADKVVTVHNAVRFAAGQCKMPERGVDDKIVTFLGRITYQKGPDYFVEAAAKVLKKVPNVRFVMAGSGDMMNHVIRRVARLGIADRFHFTGFLRGEDVHKMFQLSDVYVMPSVSEPFGISPLEAMRSNVPVIISKQSGVAEVLDYAVKVDYWDVDALADAIYGLIQYPALAGMFASKGLEEVTNLKWNDAAAKIKTVYEAVIEENKKQ